VQILKITAIICWQFTYHYPIICRGVEFCGLVLRRGILFLLKQYCTSYSAATGPSHHNVIIFPKHLLKLLGDSRQRACRWPYYYKPTRWLGLLSTRPMISLSVAERCPLTNAELLFLLIAGHVCVWKSCWESLNSRLSKLTGCKSVYWLLYHNRVLRVTYNTMYFIYLWLNQTWMNDWMS